MIYILMLILIPFLCSHGFLLPLQVKDAKIKLVGAADTTMIAASKNNENNSEESISPSVLTSERLIPEANPTAAVDGVSSAGVAYRSVLEELLLPLYPAEDLPARVALSRSEGYWPYIQQGDTDGPPRELTYGEFDFYFFAQLLDQALEYSTTRSSWRDCVFTDLGSGTGRLVIASAALHPWKLCRGIELLQGLHTCAEEQQRKTASVQSVAPIDFHCGSILDPYVYFGDSDLVFCFATCMEPELLEQTAQSIGRQCRPGTIIITTDYKLPAAGMIPPVDTADDRVPHGNFSIRCVDEISGWCWLTGGASTAYIQVVEESLRTPEMKPLDRPVPSVEDIALKVIQLYETGKLTDTAAFKRNVYNDMVFHGLPERFYPKL